MLSVADIFPVKIAGISFLVLSLISIFTSVAILMLSVLKRRRREMVYYIGIASFLYIVMATLAASYGGTNKVIQYTIYGAKDTMVLHLIRVYLSRVTILAWTMALNMTLLIIGDVIIKGKMKKERG